MAPDDALRQYMERILALKSQREAELSQEELSAIALELGLSEADLAAGGEAAEAYFQRGAGYQRHGRWDDAIAELSAAAALAPDRLDVLYALGQAHASRWLAGRDEGDRREALRLARRCLALDPSYEPSFLLLNSLDAPAGAPLPPRASGKRWAQGVLAVAALGLMAAGALMWSPAPAPVVQTPAPAAESRMPEVAVPISLDQTAEAAGMRLDTRLSRLTNYESASFYRLAASLGNTGDTEWERLELKATYLDEAGGEIATETLKALGTHQASVRPGDVHVFGHFRTSRPNLAKVTLSVSLRDEEPIETPPASRLIAVDWAVEKPAGVELTVRERSAAVSSSEVLKTTYVKPVFEIENVGELTVKSLKMELQLFDQRGTLLEAKRRLVVTGEGQALAPGERRQDKWIVNTAPTYHRYQLRVVAVE